MESSLDYVYLENPEVIKALRQANASSVEATQQHQKDSSQKPRKSNGNGGGLVSNAQMSPSLKKELLKRVKAIQAEQMQTIVFVRTIMNGQHEISSFYDLSQRLSKAIETAGESNGSAGMKKEEMENAILETIDLFPNPNKDLSSYNHSKNVVCSSLTGSGGGKSAGGSSKNFAILTDDSTDLSVKILKTSKCYSLNQYGNKTTVYDSQLFKQIVFFDFPILRK